MSRIPRRSVSQTLLESVLADQFAAWQHETGTDPVTLVDVGGGTGGLAAQLAGEGHHVTVIDPSPDALVSLHRRAVELGVSDRVIGRQGDAADIVDLLGADSVDVVICHRVLEVVDSPSDALEAMASCLRPHGMLSLLVPGRRAAVLSHAWSGHFDAAAAALADERRFDPDRVARLLGQVGLEVTAQHGLGAIAGFVPEATIQTLAGREQLAALELQISVDPAFRALAPQLHVVARPRR